MTHSHITYRNAFALRGGRGIVLPGCAPDSRVRELKLAAQQAFRLGFLRSLAARKIACLTFTKQLQRTNYMF